MPHRNDYNVQIFDAPPLIPYQTTSRATVLIFPLATYLLASGWGSPGCGNLAASVYYWCAFNTHTKISSHSVRHCLRAGLLANYDPCQLQHTLVELRILQ